MITIQKRNVGDKKQNAKGNDYWQVGIQVDGIWYNGFLNTQDEVDNFNALDLNIEHNILVYESPKKDGSGVWKNWKYPTKIDILEERLNKSAEVIGALTNRMNEIELTIEQIKVKSYGIENKTN